MVNKFGHVDAHNIFESIRALLNIKRRIQSDNFWLQLEMCVCVRLCLAFWLHSQSLKMQRESKAKQKFSCELVTKSYFGKFGIWLDTIVISLLC